ncbi:hypothetical protein [Streptomyces sp. CBMA156]|uniref:hypothetical protein n=1 Tax=Streptomyces sp. CBMA156 TaxID=1930280 RepID=UPI001661A7EF|nr:hypothetical protein [Streptomyces sp. CBMA156]MBD0671269.1 hypothetical protein [Streptomyces sp. CBMA156]MBD0671342.1 hypothetical protein [Streptomyces sp. CBMA156]
MRKLKHLALATAALGLVLGSADSASAVTIGGGGCRMVNGANQPVSVGYGVSLLPCANGDDLGPNSMSATVGVYGTPTTQVRVWQAVARVNADGSISDFYPSILATYASDLTSTRSYQYFNHHLYCALGGTLVIDTWITNNDQRYGSVQSPRFTC